MAHPCAGGAEHHPDQRQRMLEAPIPPLVLRLAVPTIISMLVTSVYNMADTYFVSQINTSASGAVGIVFSLIVCSCSALPSGMRCRMKTLTVP